MNEQKESLADKIHPAIPALIGAGIVMLIFALSQHYTPKDKAPPTKDQVTAWPGAITFAKVVNGDPTFGSLPNAEIGLRPDGVVVWRLVESDDKGNEANK